jgi:YggT family protein
MIQGYLQGTIYPIISLIVWALFAAFAALILLRLIFNFSDPNPFGKIGRLGYRIRKLTERYVYPAMKFLATYRINVKWAPILTLFIAFVIVYFALQIVGNTFFIIDKLSEGVVAANPKMIFGIILYALLSILILFIFIRVLSSWFVFTKSTFMGFVKRVTDPIMLPVQRLIPPVAMFDLSAMIVLIVISLLQGVVLNVFVYSK